MKDQEQMEARMARWTEEALRQLPTQKAPGSLAPRVRAAIARLGAVPWYRQPWLNWPIQWRMLSAACVVLGIASVAVWGLPVTPAAPEPSAVVPGLQPAATLWGALTTLASALFGAVLHSGTWTAALVLGGLTTLWFLSLGLGTACWRIASVESDS